MAEVVTLTVADAEYWCLRCSCLHLYSADDEFKLHEDYAASHRRLIYREGE